MNQIRLAIHGAAGRMGQRIAALAHADPAIDIVAALEWAKHPRIGEDVGIPAGIGPIGVSLSSQLDVSADVVIDFSTAAAVEGILDQCVQKRIPLVVATTGLSQTQQAAVQAASEQIPLVWAPNMSLSVNLTLKLAEIAASALADKDADVEIIERHHRFKEDAPSGTALKFGQIISTIMGQPTHVHGRSGRPGARPHGEIGYHAVRTGDNPGEHTIIFGLLGETVELTVRATNRDCLATGALTAAKFLVGKKPGLYGMQDVLGL
jgi:4-hydroxy-tetrahydrodipicolinate reductase